ncbi:MAG: Rne/Rng family ribonuclease [Actinomycetota bacterium]|nr:Rne/Rng family ribonuclease [Actinomycetota bacterium]
MEEETPPEVVEAHEAPETVEAEDAPGTARKKRRRGSRGGRGRKKPATSTDVVAEASTIHEASGEPPQGTDTERKPERKPGERKAGRAPADRKSQRATRRRTPTRRAPLPAAKRELLISVDVGEQRVAVLEDDRVAEVYLERPERRSIAGNIYLGVVDNVLPGMEAAFVEIGLEKNGFLYVDEIVGPELEGRKGARKIQDLIKRGQTVLVQAVKDPMKSKGARLTTELSLPGRFLVYVPYGEGMGVSRRLEDQERTRLKEIVRELDAKGGGIIVRTAAEGASAEDIERDLVFLQRLWKTIQAKAEGSTAPELVYEEAELPLRIVRDLFAGDFVGAQIDDDRTHRRIVSYLKKTSPHMIERVHRYREKTPLFETSGVEQEIRSTLARRVDLPSGGYLVFDYAEAFTVIDVNTGRFVGSRGKSAGGRLEDTIVKNNLEAVKEVVRQLRLRDIGGIIVIDFIDMANPKNRSTVEDALRTELERDRTKTYVVEISPLGLVEMTRQNVTDGPREILTTKCVVCAGDGFVVSEATHALEIERRLREVAKGSRVQAFQIAVHPRVLALLAGPGGRRLQEVEAVARRRFFLVSAATANGHVHLDHFEVLTQGKLETLQPAASVDEGASFELKLVEVGLYDPAAGVGKVDGSEVVVSGAAKLVGKKVSVTVGRVLDGVAYASLTDSADAPTPITFEAEAEKPTRAPSRRKAPAKGIADEESAAVEADEDAQAEADEDAEPEIDSDLEVELEVDADDGAEDAVGVASPSPGGEAPKKKRTRRGTRGGRGRKPATADAVADGDVTEPNATGRKPTPKIHVPSAEPALASIAEPEAMSEHEEDADLQVDTAVDGQPKRKRSRRGTRGGRKRKKPATNGAAAEVELPETEDDAVAMAEPTGITDVPVGVADDSPPAEYVPMSEWIEDFDSRSRGR